MLADSLNDQLALNLDVRGHAHAGWMMAEAVKMEDSEPTLMATFPPWWCQISGHALVDEELVLPQQKPYTPMRSTFSDLRYSPKLFSLAIAMAGFAVPPKKPCKSALS